MDVHFEYAVECEYMSDGEYKTAKDALTAANERWLEMCEAGDYEFGRGDARIYCIESDTGEIIMRGDYIVHSTNDKIADGR